MEVFFFTVRPPLGGHSSQADVAQREGQRIERNDRDISRGSVLPIDIASPFCMDLSGGTPLSAVTLRIQPIQNFLTHEPRLFQHGGRENKEMAEWLKCQL